MKHTLTLSYHSHTKRHFLLLRVWENVQEEMKVEAKDKSNKYIKHNFSNRPLVTLGLYSAQKLLSTYPLHVNPSFR